MDVQFVSSNNQKLTANSQQLRAKQLLAKHPRIRKLRIGFAQVFHI